MGWRAKPCLVEVSHILSTARPAWRYASIVLCGTEDKKIWEMAKRGGFTLNIAGRQEREEEIRKGEGGTWLELAAEQYAKLLDRKE